MNKIALTGPVWLASDLHLGPATPATSEAFLAFLQAAREEAGALLLPGDIFDAWIGDDAIRVAPPWLATVLKALRETAAGIPVWLGRGNRDFLMGEELAAAIGAKLLPEPALLETDYGTVLLTHGDEFCTDDAPYQQFRAMVRNPQWQAAFGQDHSGTLAMAQQARGESQAANQMKSQEIMDVNPGAIEAVFRDTGVSLLVHGHAPPGPPRAGGRRQEARALGAADWDCDHAQRRAGWLVIDQDGLTFYDLDTED